MKRQLENKNIVIIGGTTGIGLAAAKAFLSEGAKLVVVGLDEEKAAAAQNALGGDCYALHADGADGSTAPKAIEACIQRFGSFDGLYHIAGGSGRKMGDGPPSMS